MHGILKTNFSVFSRTMQKNEYALYSYFRSSSAWRVRIGLALKKLEYKYIPVHLVKDGGEQKKEEFAKLNPMKVMGELHDTEISNKDCSSMSRRSWLMEKMFSQKAWRFWNISKKSIQNQHCYQRTQFSEQRSELQVSWLIQEFSRYKT